MCAHIIQYLLDIGQGFRVFPWRVQYGPDRPERQSQSAACASRVEREGTPIGVERPRYLRQAGQCVTENGKGIGLVPWLPRSLSHRQPSPAVCPSRLVVVLAVRQQAQVGQCP